MNRALTTAERPELYVRVLLATTSAATAALVAFNFTVNPFGYYPPRLVKQLAWDPVAAKLDLMRHYRAPDVLILGSSRVMILAPRDVQEITGRRAFNAGLGGASPSDLHIMLRYALESCRWQPRELIVGIDMDALCTSRLIHPLLVPKPELAPFIPHTVRWQGFRQRGAALLSSHQTVSSLKAMHLTLQRTGFPPPSLVIEEDGFTRITGGQSPSAIQTIQDWKALYSNLSLDTEQQSYLEQTLQLAKARNIRVRAFMTPYHPRMLRELRQHSEFDVHRAGLRQYLDGLQQRFPNFTCLDLSEVSSFDGDENQFYDYVHYKPANARRILVRIYGEFLTKQKRKLLINKR